ncbi:MAG: hypothetical protein O2954_03170 [bacterium]|nr:hypothetical protein [bacterium]
MALTETVEQTAPKPAIAQRGITVRSIVLGAGTAAALCIWTNYTEFVMHSAALVMSNLPMSAFLPFTFWIFVNIGLRKWFPRIALSGTELLVILCMGWMVGNVPAIGWTGYWMGIVTAPYYYASPENGWRDAFFGSMPRYLLPDEQAVEWFYNGLPPHTPMPLGSWLSPLFWWFSAGVAVVGMGLCLTVIFRKQWEEHEKLTFPLATIPMNLTEGFNRPGRDVPELFKNTLFWLGFLIPAFVIGWNILGYFNPGIPRMTVFDGYISKNITFARQFPPYSFRILPSLIAFTYLCNLDILLSFWLFGLLAPIKIGLMNTTGFAVGLPGQPMNPTETLHMESHGALMALAIWSFWVSRKHLRDVVRRAFSQDRSEDPKGGLMSYRTALLGLAFCWAFLVGWLAAAGEGVFLAIGSVLLMSAAYFCVTKYLAASGFAYIFPPDVHGGTFLKTAFGTANLTAEQLTGIQLHNSGAFIGAARIMGMPMMPHYMRMTNGIPNRSRLIPSLWIAFAAGAGASFAYVLHLCYTEAGMNLRTYTLTTANNYMWNGLASAIDSSNRTVPDPQKLAVWLTGAAQVFLLSALKTWIPRWPLHPVGLAFQRTMGSMAFGFSAFLAWIIKLAVLHFGGIGLFNKTRPFFLGLLLGYTTFIGISALVDSIWFPGQGHWVHGW